MSTSIMNPITKKAYKAEFETSNITLEELHSKYNIDPEQLGDTSSWEKRSSAVTVMAEEQPPKMPRDKQIEPAHLVEDETNFLDTIQETKRLALTSTKEFFENYDTEEVTTKEFKDMVGVLKDLESGELIRQGKDSGPTVNILIQNLTERFQDDC